MAPNNMDDWHPVWKLCQPSWKKHFPETEYTHILWNDDDLDKFVETEFKGLYSEFYNSAPFHLIKLDFVRLLLLYRYGGIYVDMDMFCYKNFYNEITKNVALVEDTNFSDSMRFDHGIVMNNMIISEKNNDFIKKYIDLIIDGFYEYDSYLHRKSYCYDITVFTMTRAYIKYNKKDDLQILPKQQYNPQPLFYDDNICVKHMFSFTWGKDDIEEIKNTNINDMSLEEKYKKIYYERRININLDDWDFYKNYLT